MREVWAAAMNHLAHAVLAGNDEALQLGGMLGDFVRGRPDPARFSAAVIIGIRLHRAIDVYTDAHPQVAAARCLLPPPYRRYAGILLDMWFDHCLARDFSRWCAQPLAPYAAALRTLLRRHHASLPPALQRFQVYMEANDLPRAYAEPVMLDKALRGIGQRLRRDNPLDSAWPVLAAHEIALQRHFEAFFPQLQAFARDWIAREYALDAAAPPGDEGLRAAP